MSIDEASPEEWDKLTSKQRADILVDSVLKLPEPRMGTSSLESPETKTMAKLFSEGPIGTKEHDPVNKPDHYNVGAIEAIEAIKASMPENEFRGYLKGNLMKYVWRYDYKGKPVEDLRKARWYLERLIEELL